MARIFFVSLLFLSIQSLQAKEAEELKLPQFSEKVMEQGTDEKPTSHCKHTTNANGKNISSTCGTDKESVEAPRSQSQRLGESDGVSSDWANEQLQKAQRQ